MKAVENWRPTKFILSDGILKGSLDESAVAVSSRLITHLLAASLHPLLQSHASGRLLDLGCGNVPLFAAYRDRVDSVTCMDWVNSLHQLQHVDQACDLNEPLPLADACFDTVVLTDVLEHVAAPGLLLKEIGRILSPGGKLIGSVPFLYRLHEEPFDHHRFTSHALLRLAQLSGLKVPFLSPYGQGVDVVFDSVGKVVIAVHWRWGPRLSALLQNAGLKFRSTKLGQRLNADNANMPLGYTFVMQRPAESGNEAAITG